jgi:hypothetical protein
MTERRSRRDEELDRLADRSSGMAVKKTFAILGVNIDEPEQVEEFRQDLRFAKTMRLYSNRAALTIISVIATGLAVAIFLGIQTKIGGK